VAKIALIASDKQLYKSAQSLICELGLQSKVDVYLTKLTQATVLAAHLEDEDVDVIISRGGIAKLLIDSKFKIPIVEIVITGQDLAKILYGAKIVTGLSNPKIAIIAFSNMIHDIEVFSEVLGINLTIYRLEKPNDIPLMVTEVAKTNADIKAFSSWKVSGEKKTIDQHPVHLGTPKSTEGVGSITLDEYSVKNKLNKVDLIKIDTDGHEFMVLNGAKACIAQFRPKVIFEVGQYVMKEKNIDFSFYIDYFNKFNYKLVDSESGKLLTTKNHNNIIPELGTIDIIALPN